VLLWGEREKVGGVLSAVRAITPDATTRPYYLASIATSAESNNVAKSGDSLACAAWPDAWICPAVGSVWTGEPGGLATSGESGSARLPLGRTARALRLIPVAELEHVTGPRELFKLGRSVE
jgi:hypothetical protein